MRASSNLKCRMKWSIILFLQVLLASVVVQPAQYLAQGSRWTLSRSEFAQAASIAGGTTVKNTLYSEKRMAANLTFRDNNHLSAETDSSAHGHSDAEQEYHENSDDSHHRGNQIDGTTAHDLKQTLPVMLELYSSVKFRRRQRKKAVRRAARASTHTHALSHTRTARTGTPTKAQSNTRHQKTQLKEELKQRLGPSHVQTQTHVFAHSHAQTNSGSLGPSLIQLHTHARRRTHQYNSDSDAEEEYDGYDYNDGTSGSEDHANDDYSGEEGDVVYGDDDGGADTAEEDSEDSYEVGPDTYFFCPECDNQQYQELCRKIINFDPQCKGYRLVEERLCERTCKSLRYMPCSMAETICSSDPDCPQLCYEAMLLFCNAPYPDWLMPGDPSYPCPNTGPDAKASVSSSSSSSSTSSSNTANATA